MNIGIVGKPNTGKSTFFNAITLASVQMGNYPFTTIEPNVGIAYVKKNCVCKELGVKDAFDPNLANFSKMTNEKKSLFMSKVFHKAFLEVNEEGKFRKMAL